MWHEQLGHLDEQNIRRLATMSEGINFTKPPPNDACVPCTIASLKTETHKSPIEPGKHFLELIHSNLLGPLDTAYSGARYAVTFLENFHKGSLMYFLTHKSNVFKAAKQYCLHFERGNNRIQRLRTDWGGEYDSNEWKKFWEEKSIHWEPGVPGNPKMNGASKRLGQTLHKKACKMMKNSGISMSYWPELMSTANYFCNWQPVTGRDITLYEANVGKKPQLGHLRQVGQYGYAQVWKPNTGWKKFQDRAVKCILLGYKGDHIYRMLTPANKVLTFSNVKWIDNASTLATINTHDQVPVSTSSKRQCFSPISTSESKQCDASTSTQDVLTEVFSFPRASSPTESTTFSLSSAPETSLSKPLSLLLSPSTISPPIVPPLRPVTRKLAKKIRAKNPDLQEAFLDSLSLLVLLSTANSLKSTEPKTYKEAVSERNFYHKD